MNNVELNSRTSIGHQRLRFRACLFLFTLNKPYSTLFNCFLLKQQFSNSFSTFDLCLYFKSKKRTEDQIILLKIDLLATLNDSMQ